MMLSVAGGMGFGVMALVHCSILTSGVTSYESVPRAHTHLHLSTQSRSGAYQRLHDCAKIWAVNTSTLFNLWALFCVGTFAGGGSITSPTTKPTRLTKGPFKIS